MQRGKEKDASGTLSQETVTTAVTHTSPTAQTQTTSAPLSTKATFALMNEEIIGGYCGDMRNEFVFTKAVLIKWLNGNQTKIFCL